MVDCDYCVFGFALCVSFEWLMIGFGMFGEVEVDSVRRRTCTSSMYTTTYEQLMSEFGCSQEVATLGLSFFIWGLGGLSSPDVFCVRGYLLTMEFCRNWSSFPESIVRGEPAIENHLVGYSLELTIFSSMVGVTSTSCRSRSS